MRAYRTVAAAGLSLLVVGACSGTHTAGPAPHSASTTLATFVVQTALPNLVPVPGEPAQADRSGPGRPQSGGRSFSVFVDVPASWTNPPSQAVLCRWSLEEGYGDCADLSSSGSGAETIQLRGTTTPDQSVEVWLSGENPPAFYRRLYAGAAPAAGDLRLRLEPGYASLADVLTELPDAGGNYLVVTA